MKLCCLKKRIEEYSDIPDANLNIDVWVEGNVFNNYSGIFTTECEVVDVGLKWRDGKLVYFLDINQKKWK